MSQLPNLSPTAPVRRGLVVDPEAKHIHAMKQAVWLYLYLVTAANPRTGVRIVDPAAVAEQMGLADATVRSWLGHLRKAGYVRVEREGRHLRVTLRRWRPIGVKSTRQSRRAATAGLKSSGKAQAPLDGKTLAKRLGGDPLDPFWERTAASVDPEALTQIVEKVLAIPPERIRKSREALFRYLISNQLSS
jgi:DNA-binding transcriptional ArsR family regulator